MSLSNNPLLALNQVFARIHQAVIGDGCFEQQFGYGQLEEWCEMICSEVEERKERDIDNMEESDIVNHLNDNCCWDPIDYDLIANEDAILPENIAEALEGIELVGLEPISSMVLQSRVLVSENEKLGARANEYGGYLEKADDEIEKLKKENEHLRESVSNISKGMDRLIAEKDKAERENKFYKRKLEAVKSVMEGLQYQYEVNED